MSSEEKIVPAIAISNLSKSYRLGQQHSGQMLRKALRKALRFRTDVKETPDIVQALDSISFEVARGEVLGIIGKNGSGKSTLLKVLSKITRPTQGEIDVQGTVSALLEVGTGFHEELTGLENIFLNGAILGMTKSEMRAKLDSIVAFAGIGEFLDTPIKRYSSGMRLRLGFSVAAHLEPDILMVDEVLAVGDAGFQRKCLAAMDDMHSSGKTVLFVSHDLSAIENLCTRVIWIDGGRLRADGLPADVIRQYLASFSSEVGTSFQLLESRSRRGTGTIQYSHLDFLELDGTPKSTVFSGDKFFVRLKYDVKEQTAQPHFGFKLYSDKGVFLTEISTWGTGFAIDTLPVGSGHIDLTVDFLNLMPGRYSISLWIEGIGPTWYDVLEHCVAFDVVASNYYKSGRGIEARFGLIFLPGRWSWDALSDSES